MSVEQRLVQALALPRDRLEAMRELVGGVTATELRSVRVTDQVFDALVEGLNDPNPRIRWWCVQLLDHVPDERALGAVARVLDDPVPRVRRNAAHALGCVACKPDRCGDVPPDVITKLEGLAANDENAKVRAEAGLALAALHGV